MIGAETLHQIAEAVEHAAKAEDLQGVRRIAAALRHEVLRVAEQADGCRQREGQLGLRPQEDRRRIGQQRVAVLLEQAAQEGEVAAVARHLDPGDERHGGGAGGKELAANDTVLGAMPVTTPAARVTAKSAKLIM